MGCPGPARWRRIPRGRDRHVQERCNGWKAQHQQWREGANDGYAIEGGAKGNARGVWSGVGDQRVAHGLDQVARIGIYRQANPCGNYLIAHSNCIK